MANELATIDMNACYQQLNAAGATNVQLVLIQHNENDPYDTTLVARGTGQNGEIVEVECCPRPCRIGQAFNPENSVQQ